MNEVSQVLRVGVNRGFRAEVKSKLHCTQLQFCKLLN